MSNHAPSEVKLNRKSKTLSLRYNDKVYALTCEYLRVYSPSAEVRGHGVGNEVLQTGKIHVTITDIVPVGNYALKLVFDDGHDSGLYSWDYLKKLCLEQESLWNDYLQRLDKAGAFRDPDVSTVKLMDNPSK